MSRVVDGSTALSVCPTNLNERGVRLAIDSADDLFGLDEVRYISIAIAAPLYVSGVGSL